MGGQSAPSCAPGEYYDYGMQKCASGRPPPPPGCTSDGYCPPPPQASCQANDPYCRPPPPPECGQKMEALRPEFESLFKEFNTAMESFHQQFESARREFGQSQHSSEEWRAWGEDWRVKGESTGKQFAEKMNAFAQSKDLGDCAQFLPPPPMMGGPMGGGSGGPQGPRNYEQMKEPPQGNRFQAEDDEVREIRMECEAQAKEILGEYWREPGQGPPPGGMPPGSQPPRSQSFQGPGPSGGSFPSGSPPPRPSGSQFPGGPSGAPMGGPSREQMEQVHEIMRECEKKIRAHFEQFYKEEDLQGDVDNGFGSFEMYFDEAAGEIHVTGKYLALVGNPESQMMSDVTCGGQSFIDQLYANGYLENFDFEQTGEGTALAVKAAGAKILQIHDNPRCVINLATGGTVTELTLDLADYLDLKEEDNGVSFTDGETSGKILLHDGDLDIEDGNVVVLHSKATFFVSNSAGAEAGGNSLAKDLNFQKALEDGNIGGDILIGGDGDEFNADATPYGDMDMNVTQDEDDTINITIEKDEPEGKTIVVSIDEQVMNVKELEDVEVNVYALLDTDPLGEEVACLNEAEDLQDVLDPTDDGECHEWWVVLDKNGVQVLISIPHFSAKRIEIQSSSSGGDGGFLGLPSLGIVGASLAAIAAVVLVGVGLRRKP
jgi:hypothetical protein